MRPLGDTISKALAMAGITEERVSKWLGRPCGCARRRRKLNSLSKWAENVMRGEQVMPPKGLEVDDSDKDLGKTVR